MTPHKNRMLRRSMKLAATIALVGGMALLGGCESNKPITARQVRGQWSPELDSLTRNIEQHRTQDWRTFDTNLRQIHDDAARILLTDEPLGLTPYAIP